MIYKFFKRALDVLVSITVIIILSPLFLVIIVVLSLTGEKEIFYGQTRVGYKNSRFKIWKFATMVKNSENMGAGDVTLRGDARITPVGKYLRLSKLNELPQVFNILIGDMTLVGPRPLMEAGFYRYSKEFQAKVYNVKPGLTGIGAIVFRDEEKMLTDCDLPPHECYEKRILPFKGKLEMWYQQNMSFWTDILIIFLTAWIIIFPESQLPHTVFKTLPPRPKELDN